MHLVTAFIYRSTIYKRQTNTRTNKNQNKPKTGFISTDAVSYSNSVRNITLSIVDYKTRQLCTHEMRREKNKNKQKAAALSLFI